MPNWIGRLVYSVEVFDAPGGNLIEVLARASNLDVARAAFDAAKAKHPDKQIALCRKAQIIKRRW